MKKLYEELELEIIRFGAADIITASDAAEDDTPAMDDTADDTGDDDGGDTPTTGDDDGGGLTANPDGSYTDGEHTYTPTGDTVPWSDGNSYPEYYDEGHNAYALINGEMVGPLV